MPAAVLVAVMTGANEAAGGQLPSGLASLVRRPWRCGTAETSPVVVSPGAALQESPRDQHNLAGLAQVLLARANADADFAGRRSSNGGDTLKQSVPASATSRA